jgi:hypothetical protein
MKNDVFLKMVKGAIAIQGRKKADLAQICGVSRSTFSDYMGGYIPIPEGVRGVLIEELNLQKTWPVLSGTAGGN